MSFDFVNLRSKEDSLSNNDPFALTVLEGLSKREKRLPSWLIFDDHGSEIFKEITRLENYHPSVCETKIFHTYKQTISNAVSMEPFQLIELGSGDGAKTLILIEHFIKNHLEFRYTPIDISAGAVEKLVVSLESKYPDTSLSVRGVVADYFQGLQEFTGDQQRRNFVVFLGSTIGNQDFAGAKIFLNRLVGVLNASDYVMIGFDLLKHPKLLYRAYNDSQGIFEKFNMHLLNRINRQLGANFDTAYYVQEGHYNWRTRAVESYIYSTKDQTVQVGALNREFQFRHGEAMQTEHSYKYTVEEIEELAEENGFEIVEHLFDENKYFVDSVWKVKEKF